MGSTAIRNSGGTREWVTSGVRVRKKKEKIKRMRRTNGGPLKRNEMGGK